MVVLARRSTMIIYPFVVSVCVCALSILARTSLICALEVRNCDLEMFGGKSVFFHLRLRNQDSSFEHTWVCESLCTHLVFLAALSLSVFFLSCNAPSLVPNFRGLSGLPSTSSSPPHLTVLAPVLPFPLSLSED